MLNKSEHVNPFDWLKQKISNTNQKVVLFGSPGNLGDMLIVASTIQCLEQRGIDFSVGSERYYEANSGNDIYVIMGGGNYIPLYNSVRKMLDHIEKHAPNSEVVVLPSSSYGMEKHLQSLKLKITFFCRELETYKSVSSALSKSQVFLSHDAALYIDLQDRRFRAMRNMRKVLKGRAGDTLHAIREDREKTENFVVEERHNNIDISSLRTNRGSEVLSKHAIDIDSVFEDVNFMLMYLLPFEKIVSDRLHVCIGALLLGKKVDMYDNSYGKLSRVYRNSLKDRFDDLIELHL